MLHLSPQTEELTMDKCYYVRETYGVARLLTYTLTTERQGADLAIKQEYSQIGELLKDSDDEQVIMYGKYGLIGDVYITIPPLNPSVLELLESMKEDLEHNYRIASLMRYGYKT